MMDTANRQSHNQEHCVILFQFVGHISFAHQITVTSRERREDSAGDLLLTRP